MSDHSNTTGTPKNQVDYHRGDVNLRVIVYFGIGLVILTGVSLLLMLGLFSRLESREAAKDREVLPSTRLDLPEDRRPPQPILQGAPGSLFELAHPSLEMEAFQRSQSEWLAGFDWVDEQAGVVRIPIEQAKKLLLERGLPTREGQR